MAERMSRKDQVGNGVHDKHVVSHLTKCKLNLKYLHTYHIGTNNDNLII